MLLLASLMQTLVLLFLTAITVSYNENLVTPIFPIKGDLELHISVSYLESIGFQNRNNSSNTEYIFNIYGNEHHLFFNRQCNYIFPVSNLNNYSCILYIYIPLILYSTDAWLNK